jgi:hypothetical protein
MCSGASGQRDAFSQELVATAHQFAIFVKFFANMRGFVNRKASAGPGPRRPQIPLAGKFDAAKNFDKCGFAASAGVHFQPRMHFKNHWNNFGAYILVSVMANYA